MTIEQLLAKINAANLCIVKQNRITNDTGWRIELACQAIVNLYDTGKVVVQGRNVAQVKARLNLPTAI